MPRSHGRIIEQLLAGLVPIRGLADDYMRMVLGGRGLIVHRKLSERLLAGGLPSGGPLETSPLYVVGVTEEALYWKDTRCVLFFLRHEVPRAVQDVSGRHPQLLDPD